VPQSLQRVSAPLPGALLPPCRTALLNDFQAVGYGIPALDSSDIVTINQGELIPKVRSL